MPVLRQTGADGDYRTGNGVTACNKYRGSFSDAFALVYTYRLFHRYTDAHTNPDAVPDANSYTDADSHTGSRGEAGSH
jgi:hypothetical protein